MNKYGVTIMAGLATLAIASNAFAADPIVIRITGSTAFRKATHQAIKNIYNTSPAPRWCYAQNTTDGSTEGLKANQMEWTGTVTVASTTYDVIFKTSFAGSVGGVQALTKNLNITNWLNAADSDLVVSPGKDSVTGPVEETLADITMSDTYQNSTQFKSPGLISTKVGVIAFQWAKNNGAPAGLTNMTPLLARQLYANGSVPLRMFTGVPADTTKVWALGRDQDSGTRVCAFAETGIGIFNPPIQYQPQVSAGSITDLIPWPETEIFGETYGEGEAGYAAGSALKDAMNLTGSTTDGPGHRPGYYVAYLSTGDAGGVSTTKLTYNGVAWSDDAVKEGKYTFWCYEHFMYRSGLDATKTLIANKLRDQILNTDATASGYKLSDMHCERTVEGGVVSPK